jgi:hypothetical protein
MVSGKERRMPEGCVRKRPSRVQVAEWTEGSEVMDRR